MRERIGQEKRKRSSIRPFATYSAQEPLQRLDASGFPRLRSVSHRQGRPHQRAATPDRDGAFGAGPAATVNVTFGYERQAPQVNRISVTG